MQLDDLRAKVKKVRHFAMQAMSKLVVPDDLRVYIVDYAAVLPQNMTSKQTTCHVSRDPLERGIGSDEPALLAAQVKDLSEECIKASSLMREVITMMTVVGELTGQASQLLLDEHLKDYERQLTNIFERKHEDVTYAQVMSMARHRRFATSDAKIRTTTSPT